MDRGNRGRKRKDEGKMGHREQEKKRKGRVKDGTEGTGNKRKG